MNFLNDISVSNNITATGTIQSANLTLTGLSTGAYASMLVENAGVVYKRDLTLSLLPSGTEGQMLYNNAGTWTAFSGLFWDDTNSRLGIGLTSGIGAKLNVRGAGTTSSTFSFEAEDSAGVEIFRVRDDGLVQLRQRLPDATYGAELLTNPNFTSDLSGWTVGGADWTWVSGAATHAATGANTMSQLTVSASTHYRVKFSITKTSGTSLTISFGGVTLVTHTANSTVAYVYDVLTSTTAGFVATPTADFVGSFDTTSATVYTSNAQSALTFLYTDGTTATVELRASSAANNLGIGASALLRADVASVHNVAIGVSSMSASYYATNNVCIGSYAGQNLNNSTSNVLIGFVAGQGMTSGASNVAIGYCALYTTTAASGNVAVGYNALRNAGTSNYSIGIGYKALYNTTNSYNTGIGTNTGYNLNSGTQNVYVGFNAGYNIASGSYNIALGGYGLYYANAGSAANIAIGHQALYGVSVNAFSNNVAIGYRAGYAITTGGNNIFIGHNAGETHSSGSNNIVIGYDIDAPSGSTSNQLTLGNALFGVSIDGAGTGISTGRLGAFVAAPTARFHLPAGAAAANNAPLKFTSGTNLTAAEAGAMEWDGTSLYITQTSGPTRKTIAYTDSVANLISNYVQSRLENLITNGSGLLGDNTNFSNWTYDQVEVHGGLGSFKHTGTSTTKYNNEYIPVDPEKYYKLVVWAKAGDTGGTGYDVNNRQYAGVVVYDIDYNAILPWHFMKYTGATDTTLAVALNTGDAVMVLTDATGWDSGGGAYYSRQFSWWPYVNAKGYTYPDYTYSRNGSFNNATYGTNGTWNAKSTNTLTLTQTWPGPNLPAGTKVRNVNSGGTYKYCLLSNVQVPNAWTRYEGYIGGYDTAGTNSATMFPYGTAFLKLLFLANYAGGVSAIIRYSDITLNEIDQRLPGSAALPAYSFYTDLDSGLYSAGANQLGFSVGGANVLTIDSNGLTLASGDKLRMPDNGAIYDTTGAIDRFSYSTNSVYNTRASGVHVFQAAGSTKVQIDATGMMKIAGSVNAFGTAYLDFSNAASLNTSSTIYGVIGEIANSGTGIIVGSRIMPRAGQTGTMTYMAGYEAITRTLAAGTVVTSSYCYRALSPVITAGSIGTSYGLHIERQKLASGVTTGYGIYQVDSNDLNYFAGATTFVGAVTAASFSGPLTGNVTGNCTGSSGSCTGNAASATNTTNIGLTDDTTTNAAMYPVWVTAATGNLPAKVSSSKFTFNPSFGTLDINGISTSLHAITLFAGSYQVNVTSGMTHTGIYTNNIGGKAMELNHGTSNWIQWGTGGSSAPTFTTSSAGTKLLIHPEVTGASADYAIGMESNAMWFGVSTTSTTFKWYGGTTSMMTLSNSVLAVGGNTVLHAGNYNTYAPTLTGTGASGSWGISVTGSAGSATTATNATNSTNAAITNDTATNAAMYPVWVTANTGNLPLKVTSTKLSFNPATSMLAVAGSVSVSGSNGGFLINRRDTGAAAWQWYSNAGNLELYDHVAGSNKISWTQAGTCTISATSTVFNGASGITVSGGASTLKASALGTAATYFAVFNGDPATSGTAVVTRTATQVRSDISAALTGAVTGSGLTMSTARLLGRTTASTGAIEEISLANGTNCAATLTATTLTVAISATPTFTDCTVTGRMNLPTSQPGSPVNGSCYWDGSTNKFWVYSSTYGWKSVTLT